MSGILDLLNSDMGRQLVSGMSNQLGQDQSKTANALTSALPLILGAMNRNASSQGGAEGLMNALSSKHDGGIFDQIGDIFGNPNKAEAVMQDGDGILGHIFGEKKENVANAIGKSTGLDMGSAAKMLKMAAPFIMGYLGKQSRQNNVSSASDMSGLLGGLLNQHDTKEQSIIEKFLDSDGDGSIVDDVASIGMKFLGGMFK